MALEAESELIAPVSFFPSSFSTIPVSRCCSESEMWGESKGRLSSRGGSTPATTSLSRTRMSLRTKSTTTFKPPLPLPLLAFASLFVISWALCRTSSSSLYHPLTSTRYDPPPQPSQGRSIRNSIVVPAYHERANLRPLAERVFRALDEPRESELIIVDDDSRDGTEQEVARLREEGYNVELLVRKGENGLSSAVLRGFEVARGSRLVVMDADLQVCFVLFLFAFLAHCSTRNSTRRK